MCATKLLLLASHPSPISLCSSMTPCHFLPSFQHFTIHLSFLDFFHLTSLTLFCLHLVLFLRRKVRLQEEPDHPDQRSDCRCRRGVHLHHEEVRSRHDRWRDHRRGLPPTQDLQCWRDRHLPKHPHRPLRPCQRANLGGSRHPSSHTRPS